MRPSSSYNCGSGLGLSICRLLLDLLGGNIHVRGERDKGCEFTVTIPCNVCEFEPAPAGPPSPSPDSDEPAPAGPPSPDSDERLAPLAPLARQPAIRVLVVEDNLINQTVLRRQLRSSNQPSFEVAVANNGQEAVDLTEREHFDAVLMDVQMPVMDGLEATRRIRQRERERALQPLPIIGLSGNARQVRRRHWATLTVPHRSTWTRRSLRACSRTWSSPTSVGG